MEFKEDLLCFFTISEISRDFVKGHNRSICLIIIFYAQNLLLVYVKVHLGHFAKNLPLCFTK